MENAITYLELIDRLEQEKWDLIAKHGQSGIRFWPPIDAKLDKLYKWYVKDYMAGRVHAKSSMRVIKNESLEQR